MLVKLFKGRMNSWFERDALGYIRHHKFEDAKNVVLSRSAIILDVNNNTKIAGHFTKLNCNQDACIYIFT